MIPRAAALAVARRRCLAANVELILPDDPRRVAVVGLVAAAHSIIGTGVASEHVSQYVTVTLPGVPGAASMALALIPVVGRFLAQLGAQNGRTAIYLSPAALDHITATVEHELGHAGTIAAGGLVWCGVYALSPEARAGGEAPCYGAGMAVDVADGKPVDDAARDALLSLGSYGLDADAAALAASIIASARETIRATGDFGGIVAEVRGELAKEGVAW